MMAQTNLDDILRRLVLRALDVFFADFLGFLPVRLVPLELGALYRSAFLRFYRQGTKPDLPYDQTPWIEG